MTEKEVGFALLTVSEVSGHSKEDNALWWPGKKMPVLAGFLCSLRVFYVDY